MTKQPPATRQQNWERQQGYSCHASASEVEEARWAEEELKWEADIMLDENPYISYDKLSEKLCTYAHTNNFNDMLFRDVYIVIEEVIGEVFNDE